MGRFALPFRKKVTPTLPTSEAQQHNQSPEVKCTETASSRAEPGSLGIDAIDVMAQTIMRECTAWGLLSAEGKDALGGDTGLCIRSKYGSIRSCPPERSGLEAFEAAVLEMNTKVALKMRSKSVEVAVRHHMCVPHAPCPVSEILWDYCRTNSRQRRRAGASRASNRCQHANSGEMRRVSLGLTPDHA